jgi:hypothetical protein
VKTVVANKIGKQGCGIERSLPTVNVENGLTIYFEKNNIIAV